MIVDTSAIIAILRREAESDRFVIMLEANPGSKISAGSWVELGVVLSKASGEPLLFKGDDFAQTDLLAT